MKITCFLFVLISCVGNSSSVMLNGAVAEQIQEVQRCKVSAPPPPKEKKLYCSPPEVHSIDQKYFEEAHTCLLKSVTVHMHVRAKNQAMKSKKLSTDRILLRHGSEEEDKKKKKKEVPRSIARSIFDEIWNHPKTTLCGPVTK